MGLVLVLYFGGIVWLFAAGVSSISTLWIGILVGLTESSMARLRFLRVPQLLVTATLLAGFAAVLLLR